LLGLVTERPYPALWVTQKYRHPGRGDYLAVHVHCGEPQRSDLSTFLNELRTDSEPKGEEMDQPGSVTSVIQLADGRDLAWLEVGDPKGIPVMAFHGAPGSGLEFALHHQAALRCGVRLIALDRPGYGHSSYQPKRCLSDWPRDIGQLGDHLGLERFGVIGHSAGGPHALACARFIPNRLLACGVLSGLAPLAGAPLAKDTLLANRIQASVYRHWPHNLDWIAVGFWGAMVPVLAPLLGRSRHHAERDFDRMMRRTLPSCDLSVVSRPEVRSTLVAEAMTFKCVTLRASVQDMAICMRDWEFNLAEIEMPVQIWQGDLDRNLPVSHGYHLAEAIPIATLHLCPGEGHWLFVDHMAEVLAAVASVHDGRE
jgi:pimeloyl-ACP methyl ester carboxylesterase